MRIQRIHDGVQNGLRQVGGIGELLLGVVRSLLHQGFVLQQLALEHAVHVDQLVVVREFPLEQSIHLLDDFVEESLFLVVQRAAACLGHRRQLLRLALLQVQGLLPLVLQGVVGQRHF